MQPSRSPSTTRNEWSGKACQTAQGGARFDDIPGKAIRVGAAANLRGIKATITIKSSVTRAKIAKKLYRFLSFLMLVLQLRADGKIAEPCSYGDFCSKLR